MIKKVLAAFDGSESTDRVLGWAVDMAGLWNAELHGVYVIETGWSEGDVPRELIIRALEESSESLTAEVQRKVSELEGSITVHQRRGHPGDEIIQCAEEIGADLIVIGSTGKSRIKSILLGSVSSFVVMHSPVATLVVKP
ncbi:MAG: universal stress protein [Methanomicrobiaceae archaeon]|nr:universal stress protein [Methanomicrobiaceae archaeon]